MTIISMSKNSSSTITCHIHSSYTGIEVNMINFSIDLYMDFFYFSTPIY
uniref:Uncharacterized protein n=1 Tax=Siphoviridae sp. cteZR38 TaxID=2827906 RepID=A0A8S5SN83_9CAUD|nr:MAG TPA: hypothetical protein [Siphoviridae sp. cteZR38]